MKDEDVFQEGQALNAIKFELGQPEELAEIPIRLGKIFGQVAFSLFKDGYLISFLSKTQSGYRPPEPGTDDDVIIGIIHGKIYAGIICFTGES